MQKLETRAPNNKPKENTLNIKLESLFLIFFLLKSFLKI